MNRLPALVASILGFAVPLLAETPADVYLLIGQSNMAGRAALTEADREPIEGVFLWNGEGWEPAANPMNRHSTIRKDIKMQRLGPGEGFSKGMRALRPERSVGLVVNAKGGSAIEEWLPGTKFFTEAIARTKAALAAGGELKGIVWHQGEANVARLEKYPGQLAELVAALREELGAGEIPFVAGQIIDRDDQPDRQAFNRALPETVAKIPRCGYASSEGLTDFDDVHFDAPSQRLLGLRYAERMVTLQRAGGK